jgi:hypothetical protein
VGVTNTAAELPPDKQQFMYAQIDVTSTSFSEFLLVSTAQFTAKLTLPLSLLLVTKTDIIEHLPKYISIHLSSATPTSSSSRRGNVLFFRSSA